MKLIAVFGGLVSLMLAGGTLASGQPERPASGQREFDVVSVKPYAPLGRIEACNPHDNAAMFMRTGCTLEQLVRQAYALKPYQVQMKGPQWISSDRYVIQARLAEPATRPEMLRMLQPVLAERFHLSVHWEDGEAPVYLLQVAAHGPKLSPATSTNQCGAVFVGEGVMRSDCLTINDLADELEQAVIKDRPVINRTALSNDTRYKMNLEFSSDLDAAAGPSIFSALPDQLGLTLKADKAPLRILVIDRAQRPDPN